MNTIKENTTEILATFGHGQSAVEYSIEVNTRPDGEGSSHWVTIKEYQPTTQWWKAIFSESVHDCENPFDAVRYGFRCSRSRMNRCLENWRELRGAASREQGGKRGYYTKLANEAHRTALLYAAQWKLNKALWKEITKL
jgi:hypothetical protein